MLKKSSILPKLKSKAEEFSKKEGSILDIAIYGSSSRGKLKPRDIDFAIILKEKLGVDKKLEIAQEFKSLIKEIVENPDVKAVDITDLFDPMFLASSGILSEGYSLLKEEQLATLLGFESYAIFTYSLKELTNSEKTMFHYALKGRRGEPGVLKEMRGENPAKGVVLIPIEHSEEFKEVLEEHKVKYEMKIALLRE